MGALRLEASGMNGSLELTERVLIIRRSGMFSMLSQGIKGDKEIPLSKITSVQFKKPSLMTNGYIQFKFLGGQEAKGGILQAVGDENSVMFKASQEYSFEMIRDEVQRHINAPAVTGAALSPMDELAKLAALRDTGVVTEEEFNAKKRQLLGL